MKLKTIIRLLKPFAILILAAVGYFFACNGFDKNLFLAIGGIYIALMGVDALIGAGKEIGDKVDSKLKK